MSELSRRNFLYTGGALAAGAAAMATPVGRAAAASRSGKAPSSADENLPGPEGDDQLVLYVSNTGAGEVTVLTDGHEVVFHDPQLVARVQRAAKRAEG